MRQSHPLDDLFEAKNAKATFMQSPLVQSAFAAAEAAFREQEMANARGAVGASPATAAAGAFAEKLGLQLSWPGQV